MRITLLLLAVILASCTALPITQKVRYDNYKGFRITPKTAEELQFIQDVAAKWELLDFWKRPSKVGRSVDVMVSPAQQLSFLNSLSRPGLAIETWIPNVQTLIDEEAADMVRRKTIVNPDMVFDYNSYHPYPEIAQWMDDFVAENTGVTKVPVTSTVEGQTVYGLRIAMGTTNKVAYIQGGIHAREWISPATMMNLAKMFISNYGSDSTITNMLNNFNWIIVPVYNVDGYQFSHTNDRMWRKNRNPNGGHQCVGVDLNRNFEYEWGGAGRGKCAEDYQGVSALSEPEDSGAKDFLSAFGADLKLYIDFHSYGQYWLYPWGHTGKVLVQPDRDAQAALSLDVEASIFAVHGKHFIVGESGPDLYPATGGSEDFGYGILGVKYTYVVELRDEGAFGFVLPADQIQPVAEEMFAGMKTVGQKLLDEYS